MPDNAVELIIGHWSKYGGDNYAGITGLDFFLTEILLEGISPMG